MILRLKVFELGFSEMCLAKHTSKGAAGDFSMFGNRGGYQAGGDCPSKLNVAAGLACLVEARFQ